MDKPIHIYWKTLETKENTDFFFYMKPRNKIIFGRKKSQWVVTSMSENKGEQGSI